jgi:hypothetical protein
MKTKLLANTFLDIIFFFSICAFSTFLLRNYLNAEYLNTGYPDWIVHAFRIKILETDGFVSWTHVWANGINMWKAYQFLPHVLTIILQTLTHTDITRTMVLMTVILFVFLHASVYATIRLLAFSPLTALLAAILSIDISQFFGGVGDYSLAFGFAVFPLMLFLWIKFYNGKIQYLFPYLAGISIYMHTLLGVTGACMMFLAILMSDQKVISLKTGIQMFIFLAASSLFWFPVLVKTSFAYSSPFLTDVFFLHQVVAGYKFFGLSLAVLLSFPLALIGIFMQGKKELQWANVLFFFAVAYLCMFFLGINFPLPKAIAQTQFTRGITFVGLSIIYVVVVLFESIYKSKNMILKVLLTISIIPITLESFSIVNLYAPAITDHISDGVSAYTQQSLTDGKIWTSSIGPSSYLSPLTYQFPYSYMEHMDSNIISPRISQFLIYGKYPIVVPAANLYRMDDYFKITGVKYAFFDEGSPFSQTLLNPQTNVTNMADLGTIRSYDTLYHAFKSGFTPIQATVLDPQLANQLFIFPKNPSFADLSDVITLDNDVKNFNQLIYAKNNKPVAVNYPSQDSITLNIPANRKSNKVYLNESYDPQWEGIFNNSNVSITPTGPNFMLITLPNSLHAGTLHLQHHYAPYLFISSFIILFIGADILIAYAIRITNLKTKKKHA